MEDATKILTTYPYATLFLAVFAEQIGLPFPSVLFLTGAGALAALGKANPALLLLSGVSATLAADLLWYVIGRRRVELVWRLISWLSPEPDGYARRVWALFQKRGERILIWAKFVPSLSTFTTPLAGAARMPTSRFLVFDGIGTLLWNAAFLGAGFALGPEIGRAAHLGAHVGAGPIAVALALGAAFLVWRFAKTRTAESAPALAFGAEPAFLRKTASGLSAVRTVRPAWLDTPYAQGRRDHGHGRSRTPRLTYRVPRRLVLR